MAKKTVAEPVPENELVKVHFCIPPLRTKIQLAEDWKFWLHREYRNDDLLKAEGYKESWGNGERLKEITLPKGTVLSVDRIYIRNGATDYNSVTFRIAKKGCSIEKYCSTRFWAKLADVNKIVCFPIGSKTNVVPDAFVGFAIPGQRLLDI